MPKLPTIENAHDGAGKIRRLVRPRDCLRAYWSKRQNDLMLFHPLGVQTKCDADFLCGVFNEAFTDELTSRGYDITTLKFSIRPMRGNDRFASQRPNAASEEAMKQNMKPTFEKPE